MTKADALLRYQRSAAVFASAGSFRAARPLDRDNAVRAATLRTAPIFRQAA